MRIAVISDIHGAAQPFARALDDARREGFDHLVLLGDLLTYGVEPESCLELARHAMAKDGAILVGGNHDQLYVDLAQGDCTYFDAMPDWIRESADWTMRRITQWPADIGWQESWSADQALFAHANPFGYGDWTYLSDESRLQRAAASLAAQNYRWGIFGHLHRPMQYLSDTACAYVVGSIGQPRSNEHPLPQWSMVELGKDNLTITAHNVDFNPEGHRQAIQQTTALTQATRDMLCRYFK
jgi:predicted phosphodiesterase